MVRQRNPERAYRILRLLALAGVCLCSPFFLGLYPFIAHDHPAGYDDLLKAIYAGDVKKVQILLEHGVNPNAFPNSQYERMMEEDITPLNAAASKGDPAVVKVLLDHGAAPNLGDGWSHNPLCSATQSENIATMSLLIQHGAIVNEDEGSSGALWRAAMDGKVTAVKFLLDHGASPRKESKEFLIKALKETNSSTAMIALLEESISKLHHSETATSGKP